MAATLLCFITLFVSAFAADVSSGPYHIRILNMTDCGKGGKEQIHFNVKAESVNETTNKINAEINLPIEFGDDMQLSMIINQLLDNSMKEIYSMNFLKMCSGMRELMKESFKEVTNYLKLEDKCPIRSGSYKMSDFHITLKPSISSAPYGTYMTNITARKENQITACAEVYLIITPKKS